MDASTLIVTKEPQTLAVLSEESSKQASSGSSPPDPIHYQKDMKSPTDTNIQSPAALAVAVAEVLALEERTKHPGGWFDGKGRWYPAESERRECCDSIRSPSAAFPYSLLIHCRSAKHVAKKYGVEKVALLRSVRSLKAHVLAASNGRGN